MNNVETKITGDKLVITIDISKQAVEEAPASTSGKTYLVASTNGSLPLTAAHCKTLSLSLNLMAKK